MNRGPVGAPLVVYNENLVASESLTVVHKGPLVEVSVVNMDLFVTIV